MPEDVNDAPETSQAEAGPQEAKSAKSSYENMAIQFVSRSRKTLDLRNRSADEQADFYMSAAQVYATLELAHAIRESGFS
jgi:hypothetical protein